MESNTGYRKNIFDIKVEERNIRLYFKRFAVLFPFLIIPFYFILEIPAFLLAALVSFHFIFFLFYFFILSYNFSDMWSRYSHQLKTSVISFPLSYFDVKASEEPYDEVYELTLTERGRIEIPYKARRILHLKNIPETVGRFIKENKDREGYRLTFRGINSGHLVATIKGSEDVTYEDNRPIIVTSRRIPELGLRKHFLYKGTIDGKTLPVDKKGRYVLPVEAFNTEELLLSRDSRKNSKVAIESKETLALAGLPESHNGNFFMKK